MGWFNRKPDPISDRARVLNDQIAQLEAQIKQLDTQIQQPQSRPAAQPQSQPRLRSTATPSSISTPAATPEPNSPPAQPAAQEPIFEEVGTLANRIEASSTPDHYNDLGMRKYDLPALLRRIRDQFRGPSTTNPKLVSYLAAGGIQGLRPLRYEKRVARNRFIALVVALLLVLLGLLAAFVHH